MIYCAFEGHGGIDNRVFAAKERLGAKDAPFALVKIKDNLRDPEVTRRVADITRKLMEDFRGDNPVVVVDTFTAALGSGLNHR
jgi:hypothetical protein